MTAGGEPSGAMGAGTINDSVSEQLRKNGSPWPKRFFALNLAGLLALGALLYSRPPAAPGDLTIRRFDPQGEIRPEKTDCLSVEFDADLDPRSVGPETLRLTPELPGKLELSGGRTLKYVLEKPLPPATYFRVALSPSLRGIQGERTVTPGWEFTTPALSLRSVTQAGYDPENGPSVALEFSSPVNPDELRARLRLRYPDQTPVEYRLDGARPERIVRLHLPELRQDTLRLVVAAGLAGIEGPRGLAQDYEAELRLRTSDTDALPPPPDAGKLPVVELRPDVRFLGLEAQSQDESGRIEIRTTTPLDASRAAAYLAIEPTVAFGCESWRSGLVLTGAFEPGRRYRLTLRAGLPAGAAGSLKTEISRAVWFPDRRESLRFAFGGGFLSPHGRLLTPVRAVNVKEAELSLRKLYASNLVEEVLGSDESLNRERTAALATRRLSFAGQPNQEVEKLLDLRELVGGPPLGVYGLTLCRRDHYWWRESAVFVVTDLGLSARLSETQALCWVVSLATGRPLAGATVKLYSDRRQELGQARTDADGLAEIALPRLPADESPALLLAEAGEDLSYLALSHRARLRGERLDSGRPYLQNGYEVFAASERGVYRPGDAARLFGLARAPGLAVPADLPLELAINRPDGRELLRLPARGDAAGRLLAEAKLPPTAPAGLYAFAWRLPGATVNLGEGTFRVADYIPQTLSLTLEAPDDPRPTDRPLPVLARVRHLFGEPACGLKISGRARFSAAPFAPANWPDFSFGDQRRLDPNQTVALRARPLDAAGQAEFVINSPLMKVPAALRLTVEIDVQEAGGRSLSERLIRQLHPWPFYLGLKPPAQAPGPGQSVPFDLIAVKPDGQAHPGQIAWRATLLAVSYSNVLRNGHGRLVYDWTRHETEENVQQGEFSGGGTQLQLTPRRPGPYRLVVETAGGGAVTHDFTVLGAGGAEIAAEPDRLEITLDRPAYPAGTEAIGQIQAPFAGVALVCVEGATVQERRLVELRPGQNQVRFTVREEWRPNVYLTATLIRPTQAEEEWRPHRASGLARLNVDCAPRRLAVELAAPAAVRPASPLKVRIAVRAGKEPVPHTAAILAAVDEGVLALTGYRPDSPFDFFYGPRRPGVREYDLYDRLAPELSGWRSAAEAEPGGGGGEAAGLADQLSPIAAERVKTVALFAGTLVTDERGEAEAEFTLPEYLGQLRLMAWVAAENRFGLGTQPLTVRSPVMFRASWPRCLAPTDEFELPVTIFNRSEKDGAVKLQLALDAAPAAPNTAASQLPAGALSLIGNLPEPVALKAGAETTVRLKLRADKIGVVRPRLAVELNGETYAESLELPIRPASARITRCGRAFIPAGQTGTLELPDGWLPGTAQTTVNLLGDPLAEAAKPLQNLLEYPYGCLEQTTSRLYALLYAPDLAARIAPDTIGQEEVANLLAAGLARLESMQTYSGGLAAWPGGREPYPWGTLYAAEMLGEAVKAGHSNAARLREGALEYAERNLEEWTTARSDDHLPTRLTEAAYAGLVLTQAGRRPQTWLARMSEIVEQADAGHYRSWTPPVSVRAHLAAAYLACGEGVAGRQFLGAAAVKGNARELGDSLASPQRDAALLLRVLLDLAPESPRVPELLATVRSGLDSALEYTTQENAAVLLALGKYARAHPLRPEGRLAVTLPDGRLRQVSLAEGLTLSDLPPGAKLPVNVTGTGGVHATWRVTGVPTSGRVEERDEGLSIRHFLLVGDGSYLQPAAIHQGNLYLLVLQVTAQRDLPNGVAVALLPGGLEVENQDLRTGAQLASPHTRGHIHALRPQQVEARDDRLILFTNFPAGIAEYACLVRAVTVGTFVWPAATASCQYDPRVQSIHGQGTLRIEP